MDVLGTPVEPACDVPEAVRVMRSLTRLEKLDFWLRNPDYLADELMIELEASRLPSATVQPHVERMLAPSAHGRHYPMIRYRFGAYEVVDNALAKLKSLGLIVHQRGADSGNRSRHDYYLLLRGTEVANDMRDSVPELSWYEQQADAIGFLSEAMQGSAARRRQYEQPEYRDAVLGAEIPPIFDRARQRAIRLGLIEEAA